SDLAEFVAVGVFVLAATDADATHGLAVHLDGIGFRIVLTLEEIEPGIGRFMGVGMREARRGVARHVRAVGMPHQRVAVAACPGADAAEAEIDIQKCVHPAASRASASRSTAITSISL